MDFCRNNPVLTNLVDLFIFESRASEITVQCSMEKYNSCYPTYLTNVKSQPTGILNISCLSEQLSMGVMSQKKGALVTQKSLNIALALFFSVRFVLIAAPVLLHSILSIFGLFSINFKCHNKYRYALANIQSAIKTSI